MRATLIFFFLCLLPLLASCGHSDDAFWDDPSGTGQMALAQAQSILQEANVSESFLFFTDPHLLSGENQFVQDTKNKLIESFQLAKELYDKLSLDFCLCGGDWLNQRDSQEMAKEKLLYADHQMKTIFSRYYKMMGNHDTNYQGYLSISEKQRGDLPQAFIDNEYFSETNSSYYSFEGRETRFYILDSGLDWDTSMDEYRWQQIFWLADQLHKCDNMHNAIGVHMFYDVNKITPMSEVLINLCDAYNDKKVITLGWKEVDFTETKGKIHLILSGHNHTDGLTFEGRHSNIPIVRTCNYTINDTRTFDICLIDYPRMLMRMIRVGEGESRTIVLPL